VNLLPQGLRSSELFDGLPEWETRKFSSLCSEKRFPQAATIFTTGAPSGFMYILESGLVKLISLSEKGQETILHILKPGDVFGELLLSQERRTFTAVVVEDALVTMISREDLLKLLSLAPRLALNFMRLLSKRLARVEKGLAESSHTWSYHRLAKVLLQLSEQYGEEVPTGTLIKLRLTHEDLANLIGTTRETVTTQLNRFSRMGLLSRRARRLIVTRRGLNEFNHADRLR
jgi:CRP/FNR family transcriptional regulator, cyclic AMP receptor protein